MTVKRWIFETMRPDHSDRFSANVFAAVISLLIFASVGIVFATTFDLPPKVMAMLRQTELVIVMAFSVEYLLRIWTADLSHSVRGRFGWLRSRVRYMFSPMAIIDLMAILPFYLPYWLPEGMIGIRVLRLIRLLRIFKINRQFKALSAIGDVLAEKGRDILAVFLFMSLMVMLLSLVMYAAEHDAQPDKFVNALSALWWALETFTKSGGHDFGPVTPLGRIVGMIISVMGICLIAIPTGILTSGLTERMRKDRSVDGGRDSGGRL